MRVVRNKPRASRLRTLLLVALGVAFVLFISASGIARLYTDWLWFSNLGLGSVWRTVVGTKITLTVVFTSLFFAILWSNLYIADRLAPEYRPESPEEDLIERYHQLVGPHVGKIRVGVSAVFALVAGANTASQWRTWLLFINGGDFGWQDPLFNRDAGFYVFRLPFWTFLVDWFFAAFVFALIVSLIAHYLNGGIRATAAPASRVSSGVKLHLSVLLAVLAMLRAVAYYFDRFELVNARRGEYDGALATDVEVQLPALNLLVLISLFGALLFVVNIWRRGWGLPLVAVGLWAISHLIVGGMFPALFQRLRIEPEESTRERQYIGDNIQATRFAYGLDSSRLEIQPYEYRASLSASAVENADDIISDVVLVDRQLASEAFKRSQGERQSYDFSDTLDVDRYMIDGDLEPVVLAVRELNPDGLAQGWERQHVAFTHGWGAAVAAADRRGEGGLPDYLISGIGTGLRLDTGFEDELTQPQVYVSEGFGGYAIVGAARDEVDYPATPDVPFRYDGEGGVPMGSFVRRLAFSLRFQELEPLISKFVQSDSEVIYTRDIEDRVRELAPFLQYDSDPYPVVENGRVYWVIDGYTTTSRFPYAQSVDTNSLAAGADLGSGYNYVRNSVKAVVDSYDGDVDFYIVDESDPIIAAYDKAFPKLFSPRSDVPSFIEDHFRYPADIFSVQTDMWARYQVEDAVQFLEGALSWRVASQPTTIAGNTDVPAGSGSPMVPQYRTTRLPGSDESEFVVQRAFVPSSSDAATGRPELTGILVARSDPEHYGELIQYDLPGGTIPAPDLVDADIRKESDISQFITLRADQGSKVLFGEMQVVMLADTVVFVRPLYIEADTQTAVPELNQVIVVNGSRIAMEPSLDAALARVVIDAPVDEEPETEPDEPAEPAEPVPVIPSPEFDGLSVAELIGLADEYLRLAETAEAQGDDAVAEDLRGQARAALDALGDLLGVEPTAPNTEPGQA